MAQPTKWDLDCIADLKKAINIKINAIGDSGPDEMIRLPYGDSRPERVSEIKARIEDQREAVRKIERQFPEYFAL